MKAIWMEAIRLHMEPTSQGGSSVFRLREPFVGVSIMLHSAKRHAMPFVPVAAPQSPGAGRITIDVSNEHFLIFKKVKAYKLGDHEVTLGHRKCMPWTSISDITFVERMAANADEPQPV